MDELYGIKQALRFLIRREMEKDIESKTEPMRHWKWKHGDYMENAIDKEREKIEKKYRLIFDGLRETK